MFANKIVYIPDCFNIFSDNEVSVYGFKNLGNSLWHLIQSTWSSYRKTSNLFDFIKLNHKDHDLNVIESSFLYNQAFNYWDQSTRVLKLLNLFCSKIILSVHIHIWWLDKHKVSRLIR